MCIGTGDIPAPCSPAAAYTDEVAIMNNTAPGVYPADMLSALMNETLERAGEPEPDAVPDALQREVALLRGILDQANVWLDVLDSDGNVVLWNQAAEDISGYTREEVVGHGRIWDWLYPDPVYRQEIVERAASIIGGEAVQDFETTIRTKDGRERVISWYSRDITDSDGDHIGSIALGRDVTRRKRVEEKLEESERRYRTIVEHANDWIWTLDRDGRLTFANRAAQQECGHDLADCVGTDFSRFIHPDDLPHVRDIYERTLQGENSSYRVRIIDSDGATIHLRVTSTPRWRDGDIVGAIAFGRNITGQVALEDRLQESEERYRAIVEQSHDAVAILQDEDILFASDRLCELAGYSQEEIERMNLSDLIHPDDREHVRDMARHRLDGQASPSTFQAKLRTGEGDIRHGEVSMAAIFYGGQTAVLASIRDVSERRRIEKRLRDSEQRLRDMLHTSTDWIWEVDTEGTYTFASGRVEGTLGYTPDDLVGMSLFSLMPEDEAQRMRTLFGEKAAAGEPLVDVETRHVTRDGNEVVMLTNAVPILDDDGALAGYRGTDKDITRRRQAEERARRQQKLSHLLLNATHDLALLLDGDGTILTLNEAMAGSLSADPEKIIGTSFEQYVDSSSFDDRVFEERRQKMHEAIQTGQPVQFQDRRQGRWFVTRFYPVSDDSGTVTQIAAFARDITEQKRMERELRASEEKYRTLVENQGEGVGIVNSDEVFVFANPAAEEIFGVEAGSLVGQNILDFLPPEQQMIVQEQTEKRKTGKESSYELEIIRPDGEKRIIVATVTPRYDADGSYNGAFGVFRDVTERWRMQQQLRERERRYRGLLEHANSVILRMNPDGTVTYFNERAERFFGYPEEEILGENVIGTIVPETETSGRDLQSIVDDIINHPDDYVTNENENTRRNGEVVWMTWTNKVIYNDDGEVDEILCIGTDITERKQMEDRLREQEQRFRETVNLLPQPYGEFDLEGNATFLNKTCLDMFQYTGEDFEQGLTVMQVIHPDDRGRAGRNIQNVLQGAETEGYEYRFVRKDGTAFPCLVYSQPIQRDGNVIGFKSMLFDITERKQLEQELRESEEKYATLVEQGNDGIMIVQDGNVAYCNETLLDLTGYTMEEVQGTPFLEYMEPPFEAVARERYEKRMQGEDVPQMYETEIRSKEGRSIPVEVNASIIEYRGEPADMAIVRDITERKQMEKELRRLSAAVEQSTEGYVITDMEGTVIYANSAVERLYGYTPDELAGKPVFSLNAASADSGAIQREFMDNGFWSGEVEQRRKDGSTFPALLSLFTVKNEDGEVNSAVASVRDITERKRAQRELEEKEAYLENIINTVADPLFVKDRDHNWILLNDAYCSFMGYSRDVLLGKSDYDFFPEEEADVFWEKDEEVFETGQENINEEKFTDKQGTTHTVITRKKAYTNGKGEQTLVGTIRDISQRKRMEQELQQLSKEQQILLDSAPAMIFWIDSHGRFVRVNERLAATMDMTPDELAGASILDVYPEEQAREYMRDNHEVMESGEPKRNIEEPVDTPEGTRWVSTTKVPYRDAAGNVVGVIGFSVDITDRKRAEQRLHENEERYRRLVEASPDAIILTDLDGQILTANERAAAVHRCASPEAMIGRDSFAYVAPEDRQRARENMHRVMEEGLIENLEYTFLREDETSFLAEASVAAIYDEQGSPTAFVGVIRDVTEQKQMEQDLQESEEKFRRLTEQSFDGIFTHNWRGVFTYVSPAVRRIAGYEPEEIEGTFFGRYIRKRDLPKLLKAVVDLKRGRSIEGLRYSIKRKDGTLAMVEVNAAPIMKDGTSVGVQGNIRDVTERAQAEERYRRLVEASPELIAEGDEEGRFVTANPAMARALGCSPEDIIGRHASELLPDTVYRHRMACARKAMETNTLIEDEDEEGGRYYHNLFIPIDIPGGGRHIQLIARDITLRKKTEQALQESREKYRELYEFHQGILQHTPVGIITMDADMRIIYENRAMKEMMGVPPGKESRVMGMDIRKTPAIQETGMAQQLDMVRQGKKIQGETSYTSVYGKKVYLSYVCSPIMEKDVFAGAVIIISDVTKRKEMNRELRESEAKFRSIFAHAPIGVALVDIDGRPVMSNPALRDMLGYSEKELASMPFPEFTHPDDVGKDLELYRQTKEGKCDSYSMEKRYICKDDTAVWANLTVSIVRDEDGEPLWAVGMVEDITERKHAEEEHRRQMQLAALGRIAAVVSHELNTPLASIALAADCLASEPGLAGNEELDTIRRAVDNASSIVKQVLGFSRMDRMDVQPIDLASVVEEAVAAVRDTSSGDASVEVSVAPCRMLADEHHLYRAFVNVVKNAVLARESGGGGHRVSVASEASDGEVAVTIADNGVGMDPEVQAQADQPFFTTRPPGEGTGLGLYIARWIVERHGGTIAIESQPGEGTTVTIRLPLREDDI